MRQYRVGLIRVLTTTDEALLQSHGALLQRYFPMLDVQSRCLPNQPEGIHDEKTMAVGVPKVVALAREMWEEGFDAVIVSCAGDPGVEQARRELPIPVIGAGESTAVLSLFYGKAPALLGITGDIPDGYRRILGGRIVNNARGEGVESVLDLMMPEGYSATVSQALRQKALGADVIALSCTGMSTLQIAPALEKATGLPVLDPVLCAGMMTWFALLRRDMNKGTL